MHDLIRKSHTHVACGISFALLAVVLVTLLGCGRDTGGRKDRSPDPPIEMPIEEGSMEQLRASLESLILNRQFAVAADQLHRANAEALVKDSLSRNDFRWMAVDEDTMVLPGLDDTAVVQVTSDEYWTIPGTSDARLDVQWQATATRFARDYNLRLKRSLEESRPDP